MVIVPTAPWKGQSFAMLVERGLWTATTEVLKRSSRFLSPMRPRTHPRCGGIGPIADTDQALAAIAKLLASGEEL